MLEPSGPWDPLWARPRCSFLGQRVVLFAVSAAIIFRAGHASWRRYSSCKTRNDAYATYVFQLSEAADVCSFSTAAETISMPYMTLIYCIYMANIAVRWRHRGGPCEEQRGVPQSTHVLRISVGLRRHLRDADSHGVSWAMGHVGPRKKTCRGFRAQ